MIRRRESQFVWDAQKEKANVKKHGMDFSTAIEAFKDPQRKIFLDKIHSNSERRFFCIGKVGQKILTVRFMYRDTKIRIIGAGYLEKGSKIL